MRRSDLITWLIAAAAVVFTLGYVALAHAAPPPTPPGDTTRAAPPAAPEPRADDTQARRAISQPGNNAPFWRAVREGGEAPAGSTLPGAEQGTLIQPLLQYPGLRFTTAGEAWRQVRNHWIVPYGGALLLIVALAIALFHWRKGPLGHAENGGRDIERFTAFERAAHWSNAIAFCVLAVSGLVMAFGRSTLLPVMGPDLFGALAYALKTLHNFAGPLFAVSLLIVFIVFVRDNLPRKGDGAWLRRAGGLLRGKELPSHRFNAGEKVVFWAGVLALGGLVVGSGLVLDQLVPDMDYRRGDMQVAHMVHASAALLMIAVFIGHIYIGTIGMRGAWRAMRHGEVDAAWAKEHHALWYADIQAGRIPARRTPPDPSAAAQPATR